MHLKQLIGIILLSATPILVCFASEKGVVLKVDSLRSEPYADAKTIGKLAKGDHVDILSKKGAWLQVKSNRNSGWVRLLSVKRGSIQNSGNGIVGAIDIASGRAGTGKVVSTTGVRGLSAEDLKAAKFNEAEVKLMESYTIEPSLAKSFANDGGLKIISVKSLKEVKQ